jgi:hypothetical protein
VREVATPERTEDLGFPAFATKNTTRVAGADPVANAVAVALAVYPSAGGIPGPDAVTLVDETDWQAGIAAASLVAAPVSAPVLVTTGDELPELTESAIDELDPNGSAATAGREAFVIGAAPKPDGLDTLEVDADGVAALAAEVDRLRDRRPGRRARATRCCSPSATRCRRRPSRPCATTTVSRCTCSDQPTRSAPKR